MGSADRKEREKEIRRTDIIEAAERIIFAKGYDAATMDDVAKEAQFSKRTVYIYFNSKEQIYFEIMARGYRRLLELLEQDGTGSPAGSAPEEIRRIGWLFYRFGIEFPDYFQAIMEYENGEMDFLKGVPDSSREECYALGEKIMERLISILDRGLAEETLRFEGDSRRTALVLWASIVGIFNMARRKKHYLEHYYQTTGEQLISEAFDLLLRSIARPAGGEFQ
ncbi:TetR/AcrR family transcriptional regulator [Paenibacillus sp. YN15]|uniref:TetR/AcrR family transcriptional regulator n=1 Tax=Paenibacillus sp. YN15 TaxID=1742774 RepID=UPI000DCC87B2|nr:TetR/AcrR family transcriptional regulator [Paenibacillus sp. YN15]RAV05626.1 TetR/AcrR family transcriptional regulator [Paenibacillus sp. YN15]